MKTLRLKVDGNDLETAEAVEALARAAEILRSGGLVAFPTETVYGLGANALDAVSIGKIFSAKSRPAWDPVIVHVASQAMLAGLVEEVPKSAGRLMEAFWPGPLTLLLKRTAAVPDAVTAGRPLVGVRMPSHPVALEMIRRAGMPVAAPSANRFGHVSPTTAEHVLNDLDGRIDAVLDAGPALRGVESTVLDPSTMPMTIYRPGAVTAEQIARIAGAVAEFTSREPLRETPREAMTSPGVGLKHYAPRARLILVEGTRDELGARLVAASQAEREQNVGVMLPEGLTTSREFGSAEIFGWGSWDEPETLAQGLYRGLRALDSAGCTVILCPLPPAKGIGVAIRDRLGKAASRG